MAQIIEKVQSLLPGHGGNQAAWLDAKGARLRVDKSELPAAGADEVVIRNHAVAVNPVDWKIQDSGMFIQNWPIALGCDVAGEVHEVGSNVTKFKKGDRVLAHALSLVSQDAKNGGFNLYTAVAAERTALIPANITFTQASVLPLALSTAAPGLYGSRDEGHLGLPQPTLEPTELGKTILVWGGASSVGAVAVQLAAASGAKVVATASAHNHALLKEWGATAVVDYRAPNVVDDVVAAIRAAGGEFAGVYDAIAEESSYRHVLPIVTALGGGNVAVVLGPPKEVPENVKVGGIFAGFPMKHTIWQDYVAQALQAGKLKCVPEPMVIGKGLDKVQEGLDANKKGVSAKKVVIEL